MRKSQPIVALKLRFSEICEKSREKMPKDCPFRMLTVIIINIATDVSTRVSGLNIMCKVFASV